MVLASRIHTLLSQSSSSDRAINLVNSQPSLFAQAAEADGVREKDPPVFGALFSEDNRMLVISTYPQTAHETCLDCL